MPTKICELQSGICSVSLAISSILYLILLDFHISVTSFFPGVLHKIFRITISYIGISQHIIEIDHYFLLMTKVSEYPLQSSLLQSVNFPSIFI